MKILVTGATGLLGWDLCRRFKREHEVIGWSRRMRQGVDITDRDAVSKGMRDLKPHWVIHCAAMTDVDACESNPTAARQVNAQGAQNVAQACEETGAFFIGVSTDYVFDGQLDRPYREEDAPHPLGVYAQSKREGEEAALRSASRSWVVRVSGLFGSGRPNFIQEAAQALRKGEPVRVVTDQVNSPSYTADVAVGIEQLIRCLDQGSPSHGLLHLANSGEASRWEVAQVMAQLLGVSCSLIHKTTWSQLNRPARRPPHSRLDCGRFSQMTGRPLRSWQEALRHFLQAEILDPTPQP